MNLYHLNKIQDVFDSFVKKQEVAGLNILIYKDDKEVGYWQAGCKNIEKNQAFTRDTICRLYSMSKPITSIAAMILVEQGKLDLGAPVANYIPAFWNVTVCSEGGKNGKPVKAQKPILIQDLLNMTSGYTYGAYWDGATLGEHLTSDFIAELNKDSIKDSKITTLDVAQRFSQIPLSFEPGTDYSYGFSADILGAVIETVSGLKFSEFLRKNIFEPLGMKDTDFYVPEEKQNRLANVYKFNGEKKLELFTLPNLGIQPFMDHAPSFESGGAGLCSSVDDYMKFASMLCNKGVLNGTRILQEKTVEYLAQAHLSPVLQQKFDQKMEHLSGYSYSNLMRVATDPGYCKMITEKGEFGWDGWLGPYVSVDLKNHLTVVMLMQKTDAGTWELTRRVKNIIYTSL
ncbi:MAG: beta-lactamase family protein [Treponema sp.]|nr:beta-lactamase family protein [Treponema sp.]